ncbi:CLUMA_CG001935, isoform A [Clunio marinus]|uniref:CLUMA_CG001935, isoform A n=1 Tax=Clunio marinus TaxID=568069 RepID=A0A1J1HNV0_9DIPT|nr:CLUMA_CG001935, isoform A [Clunio marinus]
MKFFICFIGLTTLAISGFEHTDVSEKTEKIKEAEEFKKKISKECSDEIGFSFEDGLKLLHGDLTHRDDKAKCFVHCVFKKEGFINEQNQPEKDFIVNHSKDIVKFSLDDLTKVIEKCSKFPHENPCENAYELLECYHEEEAMRKAEESKNLVMKIAKECSNEIDFSFENGMKLLEGDFSDQTNEAKCFIHCVMSKEGFINQNNKPEVDFIVNQLTAKYKIPREELKNVVEKCSKFSSDSKCENAYELFECFLTNDAIAKADAAKKQHLKMKFLIVLLALIVVVVCDDDDKLKKANENQKILEKYAAECSEEIGFDLESANKLLVGDLSFNSREAKCFMHCFFKKEGFFNENDELQKEFIVESIATIAPVNKENLTLIVNTCSKFKTEDACENAFALLECFTRATTNPPKKEEL